MPAAAMDIRALPPGYRFVPKEKELVEFYLLPRARGLPDPFPGVDIIEDDAAASTQPWKLFKRHSHSDDDEPYFYVNGSDTKASGARQEAQDRVVDGGFKWKSQKRVPGVLDVGGEKIKWSKHVFSLQLGDSGSLGWVMHEYTITEPNCASVKICHIAFTGHGQKRKRVPDGYDDCETQPEPQRARVAAETETFNQETEQAGENTSAHQVPCDDYITEMVAEMTDAGVVLKLNEQVTTLPMVQESGVAEHMDGEGCHGGSAPQGERVATAGSGSSTTTTFIQGSNTAQASGQQVPCDDYISEMLAEMTDAEATLELKEPAPTTEQQAQDFMMPRPMVQESGTAYNLYGYPRFCGMPDIAAGAMNGVEWGGFCFC